MAGLGPFRFKDYVPGERIVLERNPYYWKADRAATACRTDRGVRSSRATTRRRCAFRLEADVASRLSAENFGVLTKAGPTAPYKLFDLGAGLDYSFLFFNLNDLGPTLRDTTRKQAWFRQVAFRQAISLAIDRDAIVRLVYRGRATPLWGHVPPGNKVWVNRSIPQTPRSVDGARRLLKSSGFRGRRKAR
jgi:peptide/nickel transport system substrate-binding protein